MTPSSIDHLQQHFEAFELKLWDSIKEALIDDEMSWDQVVDVVRFTKELRAMKENMNTLKRYCRNPY